MGLLDDISKLTTPATQLPDIEDDNYDDSSKPKSGVKNRAKLANFDFEEGKYAGSAVSRKELFGDISEISGLKGRISDDEEEEDEEDEEEEEAEEMEIAGESENSENLEDEEDFESENEDEDQISSKLEITTLSHKEDTDKGDKAESVRNQRQVWDDLMYSNIRMHALLNSINQMPRGDARKALLKNCDEKTQNSLKKALENMAKLRNVVQQANDCFGAGDAPKDEEDDEEIPSDEEILSDEGEEIDDEEGDLEEEETSKKSEGTSLKSLKKNLEKLDGSMDKFRATTITKWYNRTKLLNSKAINHADFSGFEKGSILGQIAKVLNDEEKLLKKVRTNRSGKARIGAAADDVITTDNEIFDDSDFYQLLLKQMIESRNQQNNQQDGADMTRSYMELQSMFSNKKKRDVSQLSSKDRRLKYEPIAKLINFYPSKPSVVTWSHESRNELFKSLFS